jgi:21S rRNA (GM2251-2'-O)-methyltransferase
MLRSAYFLGAGGVLGSEKNCAPLSAAASKASAGCLEEMIIYSSPNLARTLADACKDGWLVLGADAGPAAVQSRQVEVDGPTVIVLGSEGDGLRTNVKRACSQLVRIESSGSLETRLLDSLNVSVATGILLHQLIGKAVRDSSQ